MHRRTFLAALVASTFPRYAGEPPVDILSPSDRDAIREVLYLDHLPITPLGAVRASALVAEWFPEMVELPASCADEMEVAPGVVRLRYRTRGVPDSVSIGDSLYQPDGRSDRVAIW